MEPVPEPWRKALVEIDQELTLTAHELADCLNQMLLQAAVVQLRGNDAVRQDVQPIRDKGGEVAELLQGLQQTRERLRLLFAAGGG